MNANDPQLSIWMRHSCVSCGYSTKFMEQLSVSVNLEKRPKCIDVEVLPGALPPGGGAVRPSPDQPTNVLGHVEDRVVSIEQQIVIGYRHRLERDLFGVLEERVRPPDGVQPVHLQQSARCNKEKKTASDENPSKNKEDPRSRSLLRYRRHIFGQPQSVIRPRLSQEDVGRVRLISR